MVRRALPDPVRPGWFLALLLISLPVAACGGSQRATTPSGATSRTSGAGGGSGSPAGGRVAASNGPLHATLIGQDHHPVAGKNWTYTVTAHDAQGHPLSGTTVTEFAFGGSVVGRETPPRHPLSNGRLEDRLEFPARSVGYPIQLRVVVHTRAGSVTLDWPVSVRR